MEHQNDEVPADPMLSMNTLSAVNDFDATLFINEPGASFQTNINFPQGHTQCIWKPDLDYNDRSESIANDMGSRRPALFRIPKTAQNTVHLEAEGTCKFPEFWKGHKYILSALLDGERVLESQPLDVPENSEGNVRVSDMVFMLQCAIGCPIPFRLAGDFEWAVSVHDATFSSGISTITAAQKTRMELCWARAGAPKGPVDPPNDNTLPRADLHDGYPISLFRLFAPSPLEADFPKGENEAVAESAYTGFYIRRAMEVIWNLGGLTPGKLRYDTMAGMPYLSMTTFRGNFALNRLLAGLESSCNCYDLAGLTQLACDMLLDDAGAELVHARYVWQLRHGFINESTLFGFTAAGGDHLRCNTPFWAMNPATAPYVDPASKERTFFSNHAWVEVTLDGKTCVLDNTRRLRDNPTATLGTLTREEYLSHGLDQSRPRAPNSFTRPYWDTKIDGTCYVNMQTTSQRLGVIGVSGDPIDPEWSLIENYSAGVGPVDGATDLNRAVSRGMLSMSLGSHSRSLANMSAPAVHENPESLTNLDYAEDNILDNLIQRGRTQPPREIGMNTAPIAPQDLLFSHSNLFPPQDPSTPPRTMVQVHTNPSVTHSAITYYPADTSLDSISLEIDICTDVSQPYIILLSHLRNYNNVGTLSSVFPCHPQLGAYSFTSENSIFWVYGNLFIQIKQTVAILAPEQPTLDPIRAIAQKLDQYLVNSQLHQIEPPVDAAPRPGTGTSDGNWGSHSRGTPRSSRGFVSVPRQDDSRSPLGGESMRFIISPERIHVGERFRVFFDIETDETKLILPQITAASSDITICAPRRAILPDWQPIDEGERMGFEFWAAGVGEAKLTLTYAFAKTLISQQGMITVIVHELER